jgi:hypothetical protein
MSDSKPASDIFVGIRSPHQIPVKQIPFNIAFIISALQTGSSESSKSIKYPSSTSASGKALHRNNLALPIRTEPCRPSSTHQVKQRALPSADQGAGFLSGIAQ